MKTATYTMKDAAMFGEIILDRLRANPERKEELVGTHDRGEARPSLEVVQLPGGLYGPHLIGLLSERSIETPTGDWQVFADALDFLSWGKGFRQTWPEEPRLHRP